MSIDVTPGGGGAGNDAWSLDWKKTKCTHQSVINRVCLTISTYHWK